MVVQETHPEWQVLSGEYPPKVGGVADYTRLITAALADAGARVTVWCPAGEADVRLHLDESAAGQFEVRRIAGLRGPFGWRQLARELTATSPSSNVLFVQYVPHGWGCRAMNVGFCLWLLWRGRVRGDDVRIMFHEVAMPFVRQPLRHNLQAIVHRGMAVAVAMAGRRHFVSTLAFGRTITRLTLGRRRPAWLPVPSCVPHVVDEMAVRDARRAIFGEQVDARVVGHFGTFGGEAGDLFRDAAARLCREDAGLRLLLLGHGAAAFGRRLAAVGCEERAHVREGASPRDASLLLQACDVLLQPYPDGVTARRTTAMAALANGMPLVTNAGPLTEPIWRDGDFADVADRPDAVELAQLTRSLLDDPERRRTLAAAGLEVYSALFSVEQTVAVLLGRPPAAGHVETTPFSAADVHDEDVMQ